MLCRNQPHYIKTGIRATEPRASASATKPAIERKLTAARKNVFFLPQTLHFPPHPVDKVGDGAFFLGNRESDGFHGTSK
jgi:hypothetical protein